MSRQQQEIYYDRGKNWRRKLLRSVRVPRNGKVSERTVVQVLLAMEDHYAKRNCVWPSQREIAEIGRIKERAVRYAITWLQCRGLISVEKRYLGRNRNTSNTYSFMFSNLVDYVGQEHGDQGALHLSDCKCKNDEKLGPARMETSALDPPTEPKASCLSVIEPAPGQPLAPDRPANNATATGKLCHTDRQIMPDRPANTCRLITTEPPEEEPKEPPRPPAAGGKDFAFASGLGAENKRLATAQAAAARYRLVLADVATRWRRRLTKQDRDLIAGIAADCAAGNITNNQLSKAIEQTNKRIAQGKNPESDRTEIAYPVSLLATIIERLSAEDHSR